MKNILIRSFWNFERSFYFESHDSVEDVLQSLSSLEEDNAFGSMLDTIAISPTPDGYDFHYEIRRVYKHKPYTTAIGEGEIWQHTSGTVVIEGTSRIDVWEFYTELGGTVVMVVFCLICAIVRAEFAFGVGAVVCVGVGGLMVFIYYEDRNRVSELISQVLYSDDRNDEISA